MRKLFFIFTALLFVSINTNATNNYKNNNVNTPFTFVENNVEYAIFKNGEFDFNILNHRSTNRYSDISFNSGYNYTSYIERNRFGDITRINNTSIQYDYNGKVNRIGGVFINYNRYGYVSTIGDLCINYDYSRNNYTYSGYVNHLNRQYRSRYHHYSKPNRHHHLYKTPRIKVKNYAYYGSSRNNQNRRYSNNDNRYQSSNRNYKNNNTAYNQPKSKSRYSEKNQKNRNYNRGSENSKQRSYRR